MPIMKGNVKLSKLQKDIDSTLLFQTPLSKPSPIQVAPPLREDSDFKAVCFIDTSSYRQNNEWNYKAVALEEATRERLSETEKGSAQVRELRAVLLVAQHDASHIYTGLYAIFKGSHRVGRPLGSQRLAGEQSPSLASQQLEAIAKNRRTKVAAYWLGEMT